MEINSLSAIICNCEESETEKIYLPFHNVGTEKIALDLGGSLIKLVYFEASPDGKGGNLHFVKFNGENVCECIEFVKELIEKSKFKEVHIKTTGGGAHKYASLLSKDLPYKIDREDEMDCLIAGMNFLTLNIPNEVFTFNNDGPKEFQPICSTSSLFPYLLVNIGSGVSIIKVVAPDSYERISGTSLGGGTLWGLLSLLTDEQDFDKMLQYSTQGDNKNVDMLVGDIYGADYSKIGLKATTIASSFGKVFKQEKENRNRNNFKKQDITASLLYMISNNIGQIAYLNAKIHNVENIYFGGFFIRSNSITMNTLSYAIKFWSKGEMKALFMRHEGYLGSLGAFIK